MKYFVIFIILIGILNAKDNHKCLKCHSSPTLKLLDKETGTFRNFSINEDKFLNSNHGNLKCQNCHTGNFNEFPHPADLSQNLDCYNCHEGSQELNSSYEFDNDKFKSVPMKDIYDEFDKNVHKNIENLEFDCFTCHNPHSFDRDFDNYSEKIESDNQMCMQCHDASISSIPVIINKGKSIDVIHGWLPNQKLHWENVRCIDCHSSYAGTNLSHNIMPKEDALKNCESCHTKNSVLLTKLYKHEVKETRQKMGFINGSLVNEAYVIGSTRNELLDNLSVLLFALTILGIVIHGSIRLIKGGKK